MCSVSLQFDVESLICFVDFLFVVFIRDLRRILQVVTETFSFLLTLLWLLVEVLCQIDDVLQRCERM